MRCLACGLNIEVVQVKKDNTMFVPVFEHHTWQCDGCGEAERRMTFIPEKKQVETLPIEPRHPAMPTDNFKAGAWMQAIDRLRGKQAELIEREDIVRATERLAKFNRDWQRSRLTACAADSARRGS